MSHLVPAHAAHAHEAVRRLGEPLLAGNEACVFEHRDEVLGALLGTLERARDHINLDAALLHLPGARDDLVACLVERCRKGVRLQVLAHTVDQMNACQALCALRSQGATVNEMHGPKGVVGWVSRRIGRMQRQLAVVDGQIAWCGPGVQAADLGVHGPHLHVQGPIVQRLQRLYLEAWHASGSRLRLPPANYFPPMTTPGAFRMGMSVPTHVGSGPIEDGGALVGAVETSRSSITISMTDCVPSRRLMKAVSDAATRGVQVTVLLHGSPTQSLRWHTCCSELLRSRAWVYQCHESVPFPAHCTVDSVWSSFALDGGTRWQGARVGDAASLIVIGSGFADALDTACQNAITRAELLNAKTLVRPKPMQGLLHAASHMNRLLWPGARHGRSNTEASRHSNDVRR